MATRYWVGGSGNVSDAAGHWSATSGGAPGASKPGAADDVIVDVNSGTAGFTITVNEATSWRTFDKTNANQHTVAISATFSLSMQVASPLNFDRLTHAGTSGGLNSANGINPQWSFERGYDFAAGGIFTWGSFGPATVVVGTAAASGTVSGAGTNNPQGGSTGATILSVMRAASPAFPVLWTTAPFPDIDNLGGSNKTVQFQDVTFTPAVTANGAGQVNFLILLRCICSAGVSSNAVAKTILMRHTLIAGSIAPTGLLASLNHQRVSGWTAYGRYSRAKLSQLPDTTWYPGPGHLVESLAGELVVDRSPTGIAVGGTNPLAVYAFRDIKHAAGGGVFFMDGVQVRVPKNWKPIGASRNRIFGRILAAGTFENETAGQNPNEGTTTEGAGGGAIDISASNPRGGTKSLDFNAPGTLTGENHWRSAQFPIAAKRFALFVSVFTHSNMAAAAQEEIQLMLLDSSGGFAVGQPSLNMGFRSPDGVSWKIQRYNGTAWADLATAMAYVASTRYNVRVVGDIRAGRAEIAINGVVKDSQAQLDTDVDGAMYFMIRCSGPANKEGRVFIDDLVAMNLDDDSPAKNGSGIFADLDPGDWRGVARVPARNSRVDAIPSGVA